MFETVNKDEQIHFVYFCFHLGVIKLLIRAQFTCFEVHRLLLFEFDRMKNFAAVVKYAIIVVNFFSTVYGSYL